MIEYVAFRTPGGTYTLERDGEVIFDYLSQERLFEQLSYEMDLWDTFELVVK